MSWLAKKAGTKIYNFGVRKISEYHDEQRFRKKEQATFKEAERRGRLKRAKKEGYRKGRTPPQHDTYTFNPFFLVVDTPAYQPRKIRHKNRT
jgi:hypothetical protein